MKTCAREIVVEGVVMMIINVMVIMIVMMIPRLVSSSWRIFPFDDDSELTHFD